MAQHMHDRDWLAHSQAVDEYMANMLAYPAASAESNTPSQ